MGEAPIAVEIPGAPVSNTADGSELAEPDAAEAPGPGTAEPDAGSAFATPAISFGKSSPHVEKSDRDTDGEVEGDGILWPSERELNRGAAAPDRRAYKAPDFEGRRK